MFFLFLMLIFSYQLFSAMTDAEKFSINIECAYKESNKEINLKESRFFPAPVLVGLIGGVIGLGSYFLENPREATYANSGVNFINSIITTGTFYACCPLILRDSFNHIKNLMKLRNDKKQIYNHEKYEKIIHIDNDVCVIKVSQFEQKSYSLLRNFLFTPGYWVKAFFSWEDEKSFVQKTYKEINLKTLNQQIIDNFVKSEFQSLLCKCVFACEILNNDECQQKQKSNQEKIDQAHKEIMETFSARYPSLNINLQITPKPEEIIKADRIYHLLFETKNNEKYYIKSKKIAKRHKIVNNMLYIKKNDNFFLKCDLSEVKKNKSVKIKFDPPLTGYYKQDLHKEFVIDEDTCYVVPDSLLLWVNNYDEKLFVRSIFSSGFIGMIDNVILHSKYYPQFVDRATLTCFDFFDINSQNIAMTPDQSKIIVIHQDHVRIIDVETLKKLNNIRLKKIMRMTWIILSLIYLLNRERILSIIRKITLKNGHTKNTPND